MNSDDDNEDDGLLPYRESPRVSRYLCIACFRDLSPFAGNCPECDAPRLDLMREDVREVVRFEAERRLQRRKSNEDALLYAIAFPPTFILFCVAVGFAPGALRVWLAAGLALLFAIKRGLAIVYASLRRGTAHATLAARRLRYSRELGIDVRVETSAGSHDPDDATIAARSGDDPELVDLRRLLAGLGIHDPLADAATRR